nr:conjugal transfer protein TraF [Ruegeria sp. HKCCD8929]
MTTLLAAGAGSGLVAQEAPPVGVILVGAGWCSVCKSAAPVLAALTQPAGVPVLVASKDGRPIPPFLEISDASDHPVAARITTLPTTLVWSKATNTVTAEIVGYRNARHYAQSVSVAVRAAFQLEGS